MIIEIFSQVVDHHEAGVEKNLAEKMLRKLHI